MNDSAPTSPREHAAYLVAEDQLTFTKIAETVGVERCTLYRWRQEPDFAAMVHEHQQRIRERIRAHGIAVVENRIAQQHDRWMRMRSIIEARAADPTMANVPGGSTGLLVRRLKRIGSGDTAETVEEFEFDAALMRELREIETQAANELGQREIHVNAQTSVSDPTRDVFLQRVASDPEFALNVSDLVFQVFGQSGRNAVDSSRPS